MTDEELRGQGSPGSPARGCGPGMPGEPSQQDYTHPSAGWGAARSVGQVLMRSREPIAGARAMLRMNQERNGFDCPGCAWPDDPNGLHLDLCENGIKHVTWEMTGKRADPAFFAAHTVTELSGWSDFDLENAGRLTEPMRYDATSDHYVPVSWDEAFALAGRHVQALDSPNQAAFYTSGRLSNEATFLYQLWARELGTNNLPDCSNMCHEASGRALQASIGTGKGTVTITDWEQADSIWVMGVNAASNAPRMLTALSDAYKRGCGIVHINPLIEVASRRTIVPHEFVAMGTFRSTPTGTMDIQPRIGGDLALMRGVAKVVLEKDAVDHEFLNRYATGLDDYRAVCAATSWDEITASSGVDEDTIRRLADVYIASERTIISWCLGVTQQEHAVDTIREITNLLLLRGNIGKPGAGPSPIRGHSNVQGNRTCGIDHRPKPEFLDRLAAACGINPPREHGLDTVGVLKAMTEGSVRVFVGMGGNFAMAAPDTSYTFAALRKCALTVQVSTKLNRSHLVHGTDALILPCIGRTETDIQASGPQVITVEDSMSMVHASRGRRRPAAPSLLSEPAIIAGLARASLPSSGTPWQAYVENYDRIRDTMGQVLDGFEDVNRLARQPHGFRLRQPARERVFLTPSGLAELSSAPLPSVDLSGGLLMLGTMRSHDQWNTTIYSDNDRYRGLRNLRTVIFMNRDDMGRLGLSEFDHVDITSVAKDGSERSVYGYRAVGYDIPAGNAAGYMPEMNILCPAGDYSEQSGQPLMKHLRVRVTPAP
ncbi:molybdopterin-dependent oxidoreductase alpha subunit [Actinoplanes lutulentus]|uniref:Molybdopterin-dependent oxidoreductase alpha subunit n=1 Tax=Actinoplanes lutulentus TaxID=1287878 RepID=A0A327Z046_9ACTN|nr:FdhF/YdeP family oxidoreductase [Actinoplanes lutulentus]MBB2947572.1 molybdopterin-dependent oxidoreductase alpha subunit [Actinoplanes lutulentus]RAK27628.1 molybdopterin-dependent oxidoreductase alpha subunit [Actinoplanes lutulentus]